MFKFANHLSLPEGMVWPYINLRSELNYCSVQPRCGIWIVGGVRLQGLGSHLKLSCPVCLTVITRGDSSKIPQTYWGYLGISGDMVADILINWSLTQESLAGFTRKNPRWTFVPRNHPDISHGPRGMGSLWIQWLLHRKCAVWPKFNPSEDMTHTATALQCDSCPLTIYIIYVYIV